MAFSIYKSIMLEKKSQVLAVKILKDQIFITYESSISDSAFESIIIKKVFYAIWTFQVRVITHMIFGLVTTEVDSFIDWSWLSCFYCLIVKLSNKP